ncbi:MAG: DUF3463 domain-containing protein, partial [Planctomycetaceae bacterium]|nr:DUF3463 domain-containing protein [Planctomycetaceae bacterium]
ISLFRRILVPPSPRATSSASTPKKRWQFNQSPLFVEFLRGNFDLECTPWGNPTYNLFGWQKPCYLMNEGYAATFDELMQTTNWSAYGCSSGNPKCTDCMVHSGYEPSAVNATFGSLKGLLTTARIALFGPSESPDPDRPSPPIPAPHRRPRIVEPEVVPLELEISHTA